MSYVCTVIMSSYNQAAYIEKAIDSVLAQKTTFPIQLIITDDHSTKDNTVEIIKNYQIAHPDKIKLILHQENGRYLRNILSAKKITRTPYFTLLDADDYWTDENYLQKAVTYLENHPNHTVYSTNILILREDGSTSPYLKTSVTEQDFTMSDLLNGTALVPQTTGMLFRNVVYNQGIPEIIENSVNTPAERSYEGDYDRYMMHIEKGKAHFVNDISGVYRILSTGIWAGMSPFEQAAIQARTFIDWYVYLNCKYQDQLFALARRQLESCLSHLETDILNNYKQYSEEAQNAFFYTLNFLGAQKYQIASKKINFKESLYLKLCKFARRKFLKIQRKKIFQPYQNTPQ